MAQYTQRIGGAPVADEVLVSADQVTILGSGAALDPLRTAIGGGGGVVVNVQNATTHAPVSGQSVTMTINSGSGTLLGTLSQTRSCMTSPSQ